MTQPLFPSTICTQLWSEKRRSDRVPVLRWQQNNDGTRTLTDLQACTSAEKAQRRPKLATLQAKSTTKIILAKDTHNKNNTKGVVISSSAGCDLVLIDDRPFLLQRLIRSWHARL